MRSLLVAAGLSWSIVGISSAQIPLIDKMFANVSDISVFYISGRLDNGHAIRAGEPGSGGGGYGLKGFGVEASFELGGFSLTRKHEPPPSSCHPVDIAKLLSSKDAAVRLAGRERRQRCNQLAELVRKPERCRIDELNTRMVNPDEAIAAQARDSVELCLAAQDSAFVHHDTVAVMTARTTKQNAAGETTERTHTETVTIKPAPEPPEPEEPDHQFNVEVALGFDQIGGFSTTDTFDMSGSIQELPSISAYLTYIPLEFPFTIYASGRVGLVQLSGWRAQTSDPGASTPPVNRIYTASGSTYMVGYGFGTLLEIGPVGAFLEYSWTKRRFSSVEWSISNSNVIPPIFPKQLQLDTWTWLFGIQVSFKE